MKELVKELEAIATGLEGSPVFARKDPETIRQAAAVIDRLEDDRHAIGSNMPPPLDDLELDRLRERGAELQKAFEEMTIPTAPDKIAPLANQLVEFCKMCSALATTVEEKRKAAKGPVIEEGRRIDAKFLEISTPVAEIIDEIKPTLMRFMDWKAVERIRSEHGALASIRTATDIKDWKRSTVDLDALREYLDADAIEKAIRAYLRTTKKRKLRGVRFCERSTLTIK